MKNEDKACYHYEVVRLQKRDEFENVRWEKTTFDIYEDGELKERLEGSTDIVKAVVELQTKYPTAIQVHC